MPDARPNIAAVLLDLDGTLIDTAQDFAAVLAQLCNEEKQPTPDFAAIRATVSHGARALVSLAFGVLEQEPATEGGKEFERLRSRLLELYAVQLDVHSTPFDGVQQVLDYLAEQGISWGVVTNKPSQFAAPLMEAMHFIPASGALVCPDHVKQSKPHPEPLLLAARQLACTPQQCIYVGDHRRDIDAGIAAGMISVAAAYGYIDAEESVVDWQADFTIEQPQALIDIIKVLNAP